MKAIRFNCVIALTLLAMFCFPLKVFAEVDVNETNFPDSAFREYVSNNFDKDSNGILDSEELNSVVSIDVHSKAIANMTGIEHFTALKWLDCSTVNTTHNYKDTDNTFTSLDLSNNTELVYLECSNIKLKEVNVKNCSKLEYFRCGDLGYWGSDVEELDLSDCVALKYLDCSRMVWLKKIDLSHNTELETLICNDLKRLEALDLSHNTKLKTLSCNGNYGKEAGAIAGLYNAGILTALDLSMNPELVSVDFSKHKIAKIDLSNNRALKELHCASNQLSELDISNNLLLEVLDCSVNNISSLSVDEFPNLKILYCYHNNLSALDVSNNTALERLSCYGNNLVIDVTKNTALTYLNCSKANDVSNNRALTYLRCLDGQIDVSNCTELTYLYCGGESMETLNLANNTKLTELYVIGSNLTTLDMSNLKKLVMCRVGQNDKLVSINAENSFNEDAISASMACYNANLTYLNLENSAVIALTCNAPLEEINLKGCSRLGTTSLGLFDCSENALVYLELPRHMGTLNYSGQVRANLPSVVTTDLGGTHFNYNFMEVGPFHDPDGYERFINAIIPDSIKAYDQDGNEITFAKFIKGTSNGEIQYLAQQPAEIHFQTKVFYLDTNTYDSENPMDVSLLFYNTPVITDEIEKLPTAIMEEEYSYAFRYYSGSVEKRDSESPGKYYDIKAEWEFNGELPYGLSFDVNTGEIKGTPTEAWTTSFDVTVKNKAGSSTKTFIISSVSFKSKRINETNFPDWNFRNYLANEIDLDKDGVLTPSEMSSVVSMDISNKGISNLKGIEFFTELRTLDCSGNNLTSLDVSKNTSLVELYCNDNKLTELILGNNSALTTLNCKNNQLTNIDTSGCNNLVAFTHDNFGGGEEVQPSFTTHALVLSGQIGTLFYANLPEISGVDHNQTYMTFNINGDTNSNNPQMFDPEIMNSKGTDYGFVCYVTSVQMADPIIATLHYGEGRTVEHNYSVKEYLDAIIERTKSEQMRELAKSMKDYGHYMQVYLARKNGWEIGTRHFAMDQANVYADSDIDEIKQLVSDYAIVRDTKNSGIEKVTFALELDSETIIDVYLKLKDGYNGTVEAYLDDSTENIAVLQSDGRYLVQINGVSAHLLGKMYNIRVKADEEFDVKVSALSYVNSILNAASSAQDIKEAVASLYDYYDATMDYRQSIGQ